MTEQNKTPLTAQPGDVYKRQKLLCMVRDLGRERTFAYMKFLLGCEKDY